MNERPHYPLAMKSPARSPKPAVALRDVLERDVLAALEKLQARRGIDVHTARKRIKHARAVVRLLLYALSEASYRRLNLGLRDAARPLAQTRDTEVLLATIASFFSSSSAPVDGGTETAVCFFSKKEIRAKIFKI